MKKRTSDFLKSFLILFFLIFSSQTPILGSQKENIKDNDFKSFLKEDLYILGSGDLLQIKIYDAEEFSGTIKVLRDNTVQIPIVGSIKISGLTIQEAQDKIKDELSQHLLRPDLYLTLVEPRPIKISILGEVQTPGIYTITNAGKPKNYVTTVLDVIQETGGVTKNANLESIIIHRKMQGKNGKYKKAKLDFIHLILQGDQTQNPQVFDGDIISIDKIESSSLNRKAFETAYSNLAPKSIKVNVVGEVINPGLKDIKYGTSLNESILLAGGVKNWRAKRGSIRLYRMNRNGSITYNKYRLNFNKEPSKNSNPILKNGDTVLVSTSNFAKFSDGVQAIGQPLGGIANTWTLIKLFQD